MMQDIEKEIQDIKKVSPKWGEFLEMQPWAKNEFVLTAWVHLKFLYKNKAMRANHLDFQHSGGLLSVMRYWKLPITKFGSTAYIATSEDGDFREVREEEFHEYVCSRVRDVLRKQPLRIGTTELAKLARLSSNEVSAVSEFFKTEKKGGSLLFLP